MENFIFRFPKKYQKILPYLISIILYGVFFIPNITIGKYYFDDYVISNSLPALKKFYNHDYWDFASGSFIVFLKSGRLYGLYLTHFLVFYLTDNYFQYQIVKAIFNLIPLFLYAKIIKLLSNNSNNSWFFIFAIPCTFLTLVNVDGLSTQGLSIQITAIYIGLSTIFFIKTQQSLEKKYQILSYFFFFMAFFHYEFGIIVAILNTIILLHFKNIDSNKEYNFSSYILSAIKVNFKELKFYNLMILIWSIIYIINYKNADSIYGGIEFSINPELIYLTFINQIICAFPLGAFRKGYYYFDPSFDRVLPAIFLFISFFFTIKFFLKKIELSKKTSATFLIIGIALSVFPSLLLSFSNFYQNLLLNDENPQTFVQIYLQYIGMGILMLVFFNYVIKNSKKYRSYFMQKLLINLLAFLISAVIALVHIINYSTFEKKNFLINNLEIVIKAINNGIMKEIPKNILSKNINEVPSKFHRFDYWGGLEYNPQTKLYEINKFNKDEMILIDNIRTYHGSLFYQYHATSYFEVFGIYANQNAKKITEIGIDYKNHFYIENGDNLNNKSLVHNKFNLEGFVIFSKLQNIQIFNREDNEFDMIFALDSPKIFIDKVYLFNFDKIIASLSKKFDSKIFYQNKDKYLQDLISSKDGILIELEGVYNLKK